MKDTSTFKRVKWVLALLALAAAGCATNPYPAYYGYGPPADAVTPTIPYTYTPGYSYGYYGAPYGYPPYYYGADVWPNYGYDGYAGYYWYQRRPRVIIGVTPTVPTAPRSGPPPVTVHPVIPPSRFTHPAGPPLHMTHPCVMHRTPAGVTTACP